MATAQKTWSRPGTLPVAMTHFDALVNYLSSKVSMSLLYASDGTGKSGKAKMRCNDKRIKN
jgi:hypothetical protein